MELPKGMQSESLTGGGGGGGGVWGGRRDCSYIMPPGGQVWARTQATTRCSRPSPALCT